MATTPRARRTPRNRPGRGPGRSGGAAAPGGAGRAPGKGSTRDTGEQRAVRSADTGALRRRSGRFSGRSAILIVVLAVLVISYASSLKAYLQQRSDIDRLQAEIAEREANIGQLQDQIDRWDDPAYLEQQARVRFGYAEPGQLSYVALDENGEVIKGSSALDDPASVGTSTEPTAWWENVWSSVETAGHPGRQQEAAVTIDGEREQGDN